MPAGLEGDASYSDSSSDISGTLGWSHTEYARRMGAAIARAKGAS